MDTPVANQLAVIIVNYRTPELVKDCLESLLPEVDRQNARVIVVDNASGDKSLEKIAEWLSVQKTSYREITSLVQSEVNGGFSAGNNLGMRIVKPEYYLLLNSDTLVRPGAINTLLQYMGENLDVGAVGPRLEYLDGTAQISAFRKCGVTSEFIRGAQLNVVKKLFSHKDVSVPLTDAQSKIDWVSFACVILRAEAVARVGFMDEEFFMYFEDIEYCNRLSAAGYKIAQTTDARVVHLRGGTSPVKANNAKCKRLPKYFYQSRTRYFCLLGSKLTFLAANLAWLGGRILRFTKLLKSRRPIHSIPREWADIWTGVFRNHRPVLQPRAKPANEAVSV
ncbi:glycosyltransferase family 2 protein [uncultured Microbulbifer sp.]|uniref:glycosyltransferase family 2 protein n=1 Tax=uncultured Microbulbifer sp. TaxID=348147 RepID=UPI0026038EAD|nr:glycosyltransferase family 2 protein [uncultured Microbulbifer sp.]